MFENQPKGLYALALANTGERFGYYTMLAVFALFLRENFGLAPGTVGAIYSTFLALVYFLPLFGGMMADKFGYGKMVTIGILIMFAGYLVLSVPLGGDLVAMIGMIAALLLISFGTGLFKGNLQVMVGNLYDEARFSTSRDSGFSIFYMAINIGALFAPTAAVKIMEWAETSLGYSHADAYHFAFAVACVSLVLSIAIYYGFRSTFRHVESDKKKDAAAKEVDEPEDPKDTKDRVVALCLVFAVVIFFWMAFHQNGLTLTYFADEFVTPTVTGAAAMPFDVINLVLCIVMVYGLFSLVQGKTAKTKGIAAVVIVACLGVLCYQYTASEGQEVALAAPIFQQFNPAFVVALTPVSLAIFGWLASKGKEPSAPRKIAYGMLVAGAAYLIMVAGSVGLLSPDAQAAAADVDKTFASPNYLIGTYLVLTFDELLLSPMGISFVSKVAPAKLKGTMMGGWFVATALGNFLVSVGGFLWGGLPLWIVWTVFIVLCLLSAAFMFAVMKRLEKVA
ncbi:MAG: peptide MFS transporter [Bacteroidaceae bacterium]|nr:peptide MFS transporter [Bacteroidaceae bacterium]